MATAVHSSRYGQVSAAAAGYYRLHTIDRAALDVPSTAGSVGICDIPGYSSITVFLVQCHRTPVPASWHNIAVLQGVTAAQHLQRTHT